MQDPWDVTSCPAVNRDRHLYVSDWESDCIWRVSADDGRADRLIDDVGRAPRLSATVAGELVAASDRGVTVYSGDDGSQLRHVPLSDDARHAVMLSAPHPAAAATCFVVCCYTQHKVCTVA